MPEWVSWQLAHFWCPAGAVEASLTWQLAHAAPFAGACATLVPWHETHATCPLFVEVSVASAAWHDAQSAGRFFGGENSCGLWQLVQLWAPACDRASDGAILE